MPDPVLITTLVVASFTLLTQIWQSWLDYKKSLVDGTKDIYNMDNYVSNCCVSIQSDDNKNVS